ncbi:hypothetical protein [Aquimarina sp. AU119]|uniref:hypothetical protein n=1 Tax=Aquimarina sp. AU119 TaxID=2108528 RepID=UPI000D69E5A1|nr:hypothetical protein [Aquimarina sp. AU119]
MRSINITARELCESIGLAYHSDILKSLRDLNLVDSFKIGRKRLYKSSDAEKISQMLHDGKISIRTFQKKYYITLNE